MWSSIGVQYMYIYIYINVLIYVPFKSSAASREKWSVQSFVVCEFAPNNWISLFHLQLMARLPHVFNIFGSGTLCTVYWLKFEL